MPTRPAGCTSITNRAIRTSPSRWNSPPTGGRCLRSTGRTGAPMSSDAATELSELLERAGVAHRQARESTDVAARRWEPVLQSLARAYGLAAGLAAGHTEGPTGYSPGAMQPCTGCGGETGVRVYAQPWHYACWLAAGCPLAPADTPDTHTTDIPESVTAENLDSGTHEQTEPVSAAVAAADPDSGPNSHEPESEPHSGAFSRRKRDRASSESNTQPSPVDPDTEREEFARQVRRRFPGVTDEDCAAALAAWHEHVRVLDRPFQFTSSPGYSGVLLYELLAAAHGSMVQPDPLASEEVHAITGAETTLHRWSWLDPDAAPQPGEVITELDVTAQYLAAARSVECGDGEPEIRTNPDELAHWLDTLQDRPGYLELATRPDLEAAPAHLQQIL